MRTRALVSFAGSVAMLLSACGSGQAARTSSSREARAGGLALVRVGRFVQPITVTGAPGDPSRLFVTQRAGQIELLVHGHRQRRPFLDLGTSVNSQDSEQGLLGLAFPSDYVQTGRFYVAFTIANNDVRVVQYSRSATNPDIADPTSAHTVLTIDHHEFPNHNGGQLAFGPDGYLYVGVGDGGSEDDPQNNGQNIDTLLGKILRIAPSANGGYTIPSTNPFVGQTGKRGEIWAYGLRNPWRFSFDRLTGDMIIGDVGQDLEEEIDFAPAGTGRGANYGWSVWEGDRRNKSGTAPHAAFPLVVGRHTGGYCAIIGGYVVRDRSLPSLYGRYVFGDNCRAPIESVKLERGRASGLRPSGLTVNSTSSFGEDALGHIYVASLAGPVYRIVQR